MSYILQTSHLGKRIGSRELVKDVDIHVSQGEIYGFLGPNGAGKTTVMKMITNLWKPTTGTVQLFGRTLEHNSYEVFQRMGSIIEFPVFYEHMTGKENLQLHCEYMGYYCQGSVEEALRLLHLTDAADKPVAGYSLGMKQRLGIARAVLHRPQLVISVRIHWLRVYDIVVSAHVPDPGKCGGLHNGRQRGISGCFNGHIPCRSSFWYSRKVLPICFLKKRQK